MTASSCPSRSWTNSRCWTTSLSGRGACTTTVRWLSSRSRRDVRCITSGTSPPAGASRSRISSFSPGGQAADAQQHVDVVAQPALGRQPPPRGVRVAEQPDLLEIAHHRAHGRSRHVEPIAAGDGLRSHRLTGGQILGHDGVQDFLGPSANIHALDLPQGSGLGQATEASSPEYSERLIYLDNAASTRPADEVLEAMVEAARTLYANPASAHAAGAARQRAPWRPRGPRWRRRSTSSPSELVFTSGGTEADALGVLGAARAARGRHLVVSALEHPAVMRGAEALVADGYDAGRRPARAATASSAPRRSPPRSAPTPRSSPSCWCNNELGTRPAGRRDRPPARTPVAAPPAPARRRGPGVRPRCASARARSAPTASRSPPTSCTGRAAPARSGCGPGARLAPLWVGGGQERGLRGGTREPAGARRVRARGDAGPAGARGGRRRGGRRAARSPRGAALAAVAPIVPGARPTVTGAPRAPHIASLAFPGLPAEPLLHALEARGVLASAGSACASRTAGPSPDAEGDRRRRPHRRAALLAVARHDARPTSTARSPPSPTRPARSRRFGSQIRDPGGPAFSPSPSAPRAGRRPRPWPRKTGRPPLPLRRAVPEERQPPPLRARARDNIRAALADFAGARVEQHARPRAGARPPGRRRGRRRAARAHLRPGVVLRRAPGPGRRRSGGDRRRRRRGGAGRHRARSARSPSRSRRAARDKRFPVTSMEMARGGSARASSRRPASAVDVHTPALRIGIEVGTDARVRLRRHARRAGRAAGRAPRGARCCCCRAASTRRWRAGWRPSAGSRSTPSTSTRPPTSARSRATRCSRSAASWRAGRRCAR